MKTKALLDSVERVSGLGRRFLRGKKTATSHGFIRLPNAALVEVRSWIAMSCSWQQLNKPCEDFTCLPKKKKIKIKIPPNKKQTLACSVFLRAPRQLPWQPYHAATCDRRDNFAWSLAHEQITNHKLSFFFPLCPHNGSQRTDSLILRDGHLESDCVSVSVICAARGWTLEGALATS